MSTAQARAPRFPEPMASAHPYPGAPLYRRGRLLGATLPIQIRRVHNQKVTKLKHPYHRIKHAKFVATLVKTLFNKATSCELFSKLWQDWTVFI